MYVDYLVFWKRETMELSWIAFWKSEAAFESMSLEVMLEKTK